MKKVIMVQTPYQIIVALYIKEQFCKEKDKVDLIITDTFNNYEKVAQRIKEKHIFDNIYIVKIKNTLLPIVKQKNIDFKYYFTNLKKLYYILRPKYMLKKTIGNIELYDEMYCWNYDAFSASFRSYFSFIKKPIKIYLFDEGYVSYFPIEEIIPKKGFLKLIEYRNRIYGYSNVIRENIDGLYLFEPNLLIKKPKYPVYKIDRKKNNKKIINYITDIFEVGDIAKKYDRKYIIFEEALIANDPTIDDEKLYDQVIKKVGKENVIIKLHPRIENNRFSKKGIKTLGSDGIPWEAITFTNDFSDKVFIAINSNTIPNYKMFFGNNFIGIMLFKMIKTNSICMNEKYSQFWENFEAIKGKKGVYFPKTVTEFNNLLEEIKENKIK